MTLRSDVWHQRVARAEQLAAADDPASPLLRFYSQLLRAQQNVCVALDADPPSGSIDSDAGRILVGGIELLHIVARSGPDQLALEARALLDGSESAREELLLEYWRSRSDRLFFAKALVQPYAEWLTRNRPGPIGAASAAGENRCPRCDGAPQLSILEGDGALPVDGSSRHLQCATCLALWPFRRVVCPSCGNEDEQHVGYYQSPTFPHLRVDACERCGRYLKTVDLGRLGLAVPLVDEVAGASLDLWASERGYEKIELNLVGV